MFDLYYNIMLMERFIFYTEVLCAIVVLFCIVTIRPLINDTTVICRLLIIGENVVISCNGGAASQALVKRNFNLIPLCEYRLFNVK